MRPSMPGICVAVKATTSLAGSSRYRTLKLWKSRPAAPMIRTLLLLPDPAPTLMPVIAAGAYPPPFPAEGNMPALRFRRHDGPKAHTSWDPEKRAGHRGRDAPVRRTGLPRDHRRRRVRCAGRRQGGLLLVLPLQAGPVQRASAGIAVAATARAAVRNRERGR